jgi:hypothetical protein
MFLHLFKSRRPFVAQRRNKRFFFVLEAITPCSKKVELSTANSKNLTSTSSLSDGKMKRHEWDQE